MEISKIRERRVRQIINEQFDGVAAKFALRVGRSPNQVTRWFIEDPQNHRNIGEKLARNIERKLRLPVGWLDQDNGDPAPKGIVARDPGANERYQAFYNIINVVSPYLSDEELAAIDRGLMATARMALEYAAANMKATGAADLALLDMARVLIGHFNHLSHFRRATEEEDSDDADSDGSPPQPRNKP